MTTPAQLGQRAAALRLRREARHVQFALEAGRFPSGLLADMRAMMLRDDPRQAIVRAELRRRRALGDR